MTVLTSDANVDAFESDWTSPRGAGFDGVVCAAPNARRARTRLRTMVPGIRLAGGDANDQARVSTHRATPSPGADWLVVGRAVRGRGRSRASGRRGHRGRRRRSTGALARARPELTGCRRKEALRILSAACRPGGRRMPLPPALTPEQRQAALEKAAEARRQRAEVKEKLKQGSLESRRAVRPGHARRHTRQAEGRERARVAARRRQGAGAPDHGGARDQREPSPPRSRAQPARGRCSCHPEDRARGLTGSPARARRPVRGRQGHGRQQALLERDPHLWLSVSATTRPPRPGEVDGVDYRFVTRDEFEALRDAGGLPRVVRGLRRPEGNAPGAGGGAPRRRPRRGPRDRRPGRPRGTREVPRGAPGVRAARRPARSSTAASSSAGRTTRGRSSGASPRRPPKRPRRSSSTRWWSTTTSDPAVDKVAAILRSRRLAQ